MFWNWSDIFLCEKASWEIFIADFMQNIYYLKLKSRKNIIQMKYDIIVNKLCASYF